MRLQDALMQCSASERAALRARRGLAVDSNKRIDEIEQTARGLVAETDLRHSKFPSDARGLLQRFAIACGLLWGAQEDPGADLLVSLGIAFRLNAAQAKQEAELRGIPLRNEAALVLPAAFLLQVPVSDGEDPRSLRVLMGAVDYELLQPMSTTVLGQPLATNGPLVLQEVWEQLSRAEELAKRVKELTGAEARLLDQLERAGGEVTTEELLALDQTPGVVRSGSMVGAPKRGAPYMLQRRGLLFAFGADRYVLPSEVARIVGFARAAEREQRRRSLLSLVEEEDHAPRRARYARDPSLAVAAALALFRCGDVALKPGVGVPRGALRRAAERLGEREESLGLLVALARAAGFDRLVQPDAAVPGSYESLTVSSLGAQLRATWRSGGAWDETRVEPEVARTPLGDRVGSAASAIRRLLLEALEELARERWVPVELLLRYVTDDPRFAGIARIHQRAQREKPGLFRDSLQDALRAMLVESAPTVGLVDLAEDASAVRLVTRETNGATPTVSLKRNTLEVSAGHPLCRWMELADFAEPDRVVPETQSVAFSLGISAVARARARGLGAVEVQARLRAVGLNPPWNGAAEELVLALGEVREVQWAPAAAAIVVNDPSLRAELLGDPAIRKGLLELDAGNVLLVRADADVARLRAKLLRMGIQAKEMGFEEEAPPPPSASPSRLELQKRRSVAPKEE